jgi:predicted O-methyltransferase YrrM
MKWYEPSLPNNIQPIPWLSPASINFLSDLIRPEWKVLEHGSGGSTLWFAGLVAHVTSVESDPRWHEEIARRELINVRSILLKSHDKLPVLKGPFDLMLIDGEPLDDRILFLKAAIRLVRPGGWVVLDNYNRPEYLQERMVITKQADRMQRINTSFGRFLNTEFIHLKMAQGVIH